MDRKPNVKCDICGIEMYRTPTAIKKYKSMTCSNSCRAILNKKINGTYVNCNYCGNSFYKKNSRVAELNFCNIDCHKSYRACKLSDNEIIKLHKDGMYDKQIAEIGNCSRELITITLNKNGYVDRRDKINDLELRKRISKTNKGTRMGKLNHN